MKRRLYQKAGSNPASPEGLPGSAGCEDTAGCPLPLISLGGALGMWRPTGDPGDCHVAKAPRNDTKSCGFCERAIRESPLRVDRSDGRYPQKRFIRSGDGSLRKRVMCDMHGGACRFDSGPGHQGRAGRILHRPQYYFRAYAHFR